MKLTIEHDPDSVIHQPLFIEWVIHPTRETDLYWNHYLQENPGRRKEIEEARFLIKNFGKDEDSLDQDEIEGIWNRISQQKLEKRPKTIRIRKWLAAASILLVLGLSGWTAHHYFSATKTLAVDYHAIAINKNNTGEVKLILSDQTEKTFTEKEVEIKYHENGEVETGEGKFQEGTNSPKEISESKMNQLIVPRGKRSNITLADGTKLWMNSGSQAIFPVVFDKKTREIYIEGEAYLEVAKNPEKPFFVVTDRMKIKVLGTSFNINSYKDEDYSSVVLIEGSLMAITGKKETVIKPNYLLKCDNLTQAISVKEVDVQEYISWKDGWLLCNQENIEHVMSKLSKYYDIKIDAGDRRIKTMTISGKLELKDNYEEVLNIICKTAPLQYRRSADRIIMSAKGQKLN